MLQPGKAVQRTGFNCVPVPPGPMHFGDIAQAMDRMQSFIAWQDKAHRQVSLAGCTPAATVIHSPATCTNQA